MFEFPDNEQFTELTFAEQLRMKAKVNYIYYLSNYMNDPEIRNLVEIVMGDLFTEDYIDKENLSPGTILKNGICRLADSDNDFCKSINELDILQIRVLIMHLILIYLVLVWYMVL